jgi:hypothetical protein
MVKYSPFLFAIILIVLSSSVQAILYDTFDGTALNQSLWANKTSGGGEFFVSGGILTINGGLSLNSYAYVLTTYNLAEGENWYFSQIGSCGGLSAYKMLQICSDAAGTTCDELTRCYNNAWDPVPLTEDNHISIISNSTGTFALLFNSTEFVLDKQITISTSTMHLAFKSSGGTNGQGLFYIYNVTYFPNVAPTTTTPIIIPSNTYINISLNVSSYYSDNNSNTGWMWFRWFKNGALTFEESKTGLTTGQQTSSILGYGNFTLGDNITVEAVPYDGSVNGTRFNSTTKTIINGTVVIKIFNGSWNWHAPADVGAVEYLVVGGGGGGGYNRGGGGGAGGFFQGLKEVTANSNYSITVGLGGAGGTSTSMGANGTNSTFSSVVALGGGGGDTAESSINGQDGASGGGGTSYSSTGTLGGSGVLGQGYNGGSGAAQAICSRFAGGGGGGFSSIGTSASVVCSPFYAHAGDGGAGIYSTITGTSTAYCGGGGGGIIPYISDEVAGVGGSGVGGNGGLGGSSPTNGTALRGSGGGGSGSSEQGGYGSSGVVILRYVTSNTSNIDPTTTTPIVTPDIAFYAYNLNATVIYSDADFDIGTLYFRWFKNGNLIYEEMVNNITSEQTVSSVLNKGNYTKGDSLILESMPYDEIVNGTRRNSTAKRIYDGLSNYTIFLSDGSWTAPENVSIIEYIIVAGGGSGSGYSGTSPGSGGGAGGILNGTIPVVPGTNYPIVVGDGGLGAIIQNGEDSTFNGLTAVGGGHGTYLSNPAGNGGSGGGGTGAVAAGTGTLGQGKDGGSGVSQGTGGGGGHSQAGGNAISNLRGGFGGNGSYFTIDILNSSIIYALGGGGAGTGWDSDATEEGGLGGGGNASGENAAVNSGGGGAGSKSGNGGNGGSGIVIIKYLYGPFLSSTINSVSIAPTTAYANTALNATFSVSNVNAALSLNMTLKWFTNNNLNASYGCNMSASPFRNLTRDTLYNNNSCGIPINAVVKNQAWVAEATLWDGSISTSQNSSALTIINSPPSAPGVYLNATSPNNYTVDNLTAHIITASPDIDNDTIHYLYNWYNNNVSDTLMNIPLFGPNGTSYDFSRNNNTLIYQATFNSTGGHTERGAYQFDGINDYIDSGRILSLNGTNAFTASIWVKANKLPFNANRGLFSRGSTSQRTPWIFGVNGQNYTQMQFETDSGVGDCIVNSGLLTEGNWHNLVYYWNGSVCVVYLDGVMGTPDSTTGTILADSDANALIGFLPGNQYWNGSIDNFRLWNRSLQTEEVLLLNASKTNITFSDYPNNGQNWTVRVWPFDLEGINGSYASSTIYINTMSPSATLTNITPQLAYTNTSFLNATSTYTDPGLETGNLWFHWFVNGVLTFWEKIINIVSGSVGSSILMQGNYTSQDNVTVQVTPNQGSINGTQVNASRFINNTVPSIYSFYLAPNGTIYANTEINISFNVSDIDLNDQLNVTIKWFTNNVYNDSYNCNMANTSFRNITRNVLYNNNSCGIPINAVVKNRVWKAEITVWDRMTSVSLNSSALNISNSVLSTPVVYLNATSSGNTTLDNLTAYIPVPSTDIDNDTAHYIYNWLDNGVSDDILYWPLEGTNGSVVDFTNTVSNALVRQATLNLTAGYDGYGAYQFDGVNDVMSRPSGNFPITWTTGGTVSAWFKMRDMRTQVILAYNNVSGKQIAIGHVNAFGFRGTYNNGTTSSKGVTNLTLNEWHHVAMVFNATDYRVFFDGREYTTATGGLTMLSTKNFAVGAYNNLGAGFFNGTIDEVRVWNRTLSDEEILLLNASKVNTTYFGITSIFDNWTITSWAVDNTGSNGSKSESSVIINFKNTESVISQASINPSTAYANNPLNISFTVTDVDPADQLNVTIKWFLNGVHNNTYNCNMANTSFRNITPGTAYNNNSCGVPSNSIIRGQVWIGEVTAWDGKNIVSLNSSSVTVSNTLPSIATVYLNATSTSNKSLDNLTSYLVTAPTDVDGDAVHSIISWKKNGASDNALYWPMEGPNGTSLDFSDTNANAVINQATFNSTAGYDGGGAYQFDGINDAVYVPSGRVPAISGSGSVSFWFNMKDTRTQGIWAYTNNSGTNLAWIIGYVNGFGFRGECYNGGTYTLKGNSTLSTNEWHHVAMIFNTTGNRLFLDGKEQGVVTGTLAIQSTKNFAVGSISTLAAQFFNGTIDELRYWNRSLKEEEILLLNASMNNITYNKITTRYDNWTVQYWPIESTGLNGSKTESSIYLNGNSLPINPVMVLNATSLYNVTFDDITFFNQTAIDDEDLDSTRFRLRWFNESILIPELENQTIVKSGNLTIGHSWIVEATPDDGQNYGTATNTTSFVVKAIQADSINITSFYQQPQNASFGQIIYSHCLANSSIAPKSSLTVNIDYKKSSSSQWLSSNTSYIPREVIWAIGDSITAGATKYNPIPAYLAGIDPVNNSYEYWLDFYMNSNVSIINEATNYSIYNKGVPGERCDEIDTRFNTAMGSNATVILLCGINDFNQSRDYINASYYVSSIYNKAVAKNDKLVIMEVLPDADGHHCADITSFNSWLHANFSDNPNVEIVSTHDYFTNGTACNINSTLFESDLIHPNLEGYKIMGRLIWEQAFNKKFFNDWTSNITLPNERSNISYDFRCNVSDVYASDSETNLGVLTLFGNLTSFPPTAPVIYLNASLSRNYSSDNLTTWIITNSTDPDGDAIHYIYNFKRNGTSETNLYLPMEGPNGTLKDFSGYNHIGTINQATFNETAGYDDNGAYQFDGVDDFISIANNETIRFVNNSFSIELWAKPTGTNAQPIQMLAAKTDPSAALFSYGLTYWNTYPGFSNTFGFITSDAPGSYFIASIAAPFNVGSWYHLVGVWNGTNVILYINGSQAGIITSNGAIIQDTATNLVIGASESADGVLGTSAFPGVIDEVRIYNHSLSAAEVMMHYQNKSYMIYPSRTEIGDNWTAQAWAVDSVSLNSSVAESSMLINPYCTTCYVNSSGGDFDDLVDCLDVTLESTSIASCILNQANRDYNFSRVLIHYNMTGNEYNDSVITIAASNITLDCKYSSFYNDGDHTNDGYGITMTSRSDVNIYNCNFSGFNYDLYAGGTYSNIRLDNFSSECMDESIHFEGNTKNILIQNAKVIADTCIYGISLRGVNVTLRDSYINRADLSVVSTGGLINSSFINNTIVGITAAIKIYGASDSNMNLIKDNNITSSNDCILFPSPTPTPNTNITENFMDCAGNTIDMLSTQENTTMWLNHFYSGTLSNVGTYTTLCVAGEGNFYKQSLTPTAGDCGPISSTYPTGGEGFYVNNNSINITWNRQSAFLPINYSLFYSNDSKATWNNLVSTQDLSYVWDISSVHAGYYYLRIMPSDSNGMNATVNISNDFSIRRNNQRVCLDMNTCEYNNITSAIALEAGNTLTLLESNYEFNISLPGTYSSPLNISAANITLDCNSANISGLSNYGLIIYSNSSTIKNCVFDRWLYGVYVLSNNNNITNNNFSSIVRNSIYLQTGGNNIWLNNFNNKGIFNEEDNLTNVFSINSSLHDLYGFGMPLTYEFSIPSGSSNLHIESRHGKEYFWNAIPEKTRADMFNGIEAVRFNYTSNKAFISVGFGASDLIQLRVRDITNTSVQITYVDVTKYYDNRSATAIVTSDDWGAGNLTAFSLFADLTKDNSLVISMGVITNYLGIPANWTYLQGIINMGHTDIDSHGFTHVSGYANATDADSETNGSKNAIINNLDLPGYARHGDNEYVWAWYDPSGISNSNLRESLARNYYLMDRSYLQNAADTFIPWASPGMFNRTGWSYSLDSGNLVAANSRFDDAISSGGVYVLSSHPAVINYTDGSWNTEHLKYMGNRSNIWYAGLGQAYMYRYADIFNSTVFHTDFESDSKNTFCVSNQGNNYASIIPSSDKGDSECVESNVPSGGSGGGGGGGDVAAAKSEPKQEEEPAKQEINPYTLLATVFNLGNIIWPSEPIIGWSIIIGSVGLIFMIKSYAETAILKTIKKRRLNKKMRQHDY